MRRARGLLPVLGAAMALAGCSSWHWYRQDAPAAAPDRSLARKVVGHWRRPGDATCAAGPDVTGDRGRLVIVIDGQKTVHEIEGANARRLLTRVTDPPGGPRYRIGLVAGGGEPDRPFTLAVRNRATGGTVTWTPCRPG